VLLLPPGKTGFRAQKNTQARSIREILFLPFSIPISPFAVSAEAVKKAAGFTMRKELPVELKNKLSVSFL
jgi:hypothetical protein